MQQQDQQRGGTTFLRTAGVMLANMAMYTAANILVGKVSGVAARIGVSTIKKLAETEGAGQIVKNANKALTTIMQGKKVPSIYDVGRSLGLKIPKLAETDIVGRSLLQWGKEQAISTATGMIAQNIDAISDGRNLSMKELFVEAAVADIGFRGAGFIFKKGAGAAGRAITHAGNKVWERQLFGTTATLKGVLSGVDTTLSYMHKESKDFLRNNTIRHNNNPIRKFDAKFGITAMANNFSAFLYGAVKASDSTQQQMLHALQTDSRRALNTTSGAAAAKFVERLEKAGMSGSRYISKNGRIIDKGYQDFTSGMSSIASTASKIMSFESVPILNTLFANRFINQNTELTVYGAGDVIHVGSKGTNIADPDEFIKRFTHGKSDISNKNRLFKAFKEANQGNEHIAQGMLQVPEGYTIVNSSDGMFIAKANSDVRSFRRIGHLSAYTLSDADAGKYVNFAAVSNESRLSEVVSSSIDKSRKTHTKADDETGLLAGISFNDGTNPYVNLLANLMESKPLSPEMIVENRSAANLGRSLYRKDMMYSDLDALRGLLERTGNMRAGSLADMQKRYGDVLTDGTKKQIDQLLNLRTPIETPTGILGVEDAAKGLIARDVLNSQLAKGNVDIILRDNMNPDKVVGGLRRALSGQKMMDNESAGDFLRALGTPGADNGFGIILPDGADIRLIKTDGSTMSLRNDVKLNYGSQDAKMYSESRSLKEIADEMNIDNLMNNFDQKNNRTAYMMATAIEDTGDNTKHIIGLGDTNHDLTNVITPNDAVAYSAMASVNALASKWGLNVDLDLKDDMASFLMKLGEHGAHTALELGIGITAIDAILKTDAFENTRLEGGIIPFLASSFQDVQMFGNTVLNMTGGNRILKGINDVIPGLINSPLGGGILSIAPLVTGIGMGIKSGTPSGLLTGAIGGGIASAILGGFGSSIIDAYDPTMNLDEAYAISTGQEEVGIRKGRYWGLSSGSFWGSQIQYYRGSALFNAQLNLNQNAGNNFSQLSDYLGFTTPYERNIYSRPYAAISGGSSEDIGMAGYGAGGSGGAVGTGSIQYGGGNGLPTQHDIKDAANVYGLRGFLAGDMVLGSLNKNLTDTTVPVMADPNKSYGIAQAFNNANLGGMFGQTEYIRRVLPKRDLNNTVNPIRNLMPDWMPGSNYMINFKEGDAYSKIMDGEQRLPGVSNLVAKDRQINLVADLSFMGMLNEKDTIDMAVYGNLKNNRDNVLHTAIKNEHLKNIRQMASLGGFRLKENTTYTTSGNITATSDYDFNGQAVKVEVVDADKFESINKNERNVYKNKADLLASISKKSAKYIIINEETGEKIEIEGFENKELLRNEAQKIHKLAPDIKKKIQETGLGSHNLYSIIDRFMILSDVAPYSNEYKQYKQMVMDKAKSGELTDNELVKVAEAIKKQEAVTQGIYTSNGRISPLANLLPSKLMNPDDLDPLTVYREENVYSSGMKTWNDPGSYFRDDIALTASGKINPVKRAIGSGILYKTLYGNSIGGAAAVGTLAASTFTKLTGGVEMRGTYDESRDILLKKAALEYKMNIENDRGQQNQNNLYSALKYGTGDPEELARQLHRDDRIFYNTVKDEQDPDRQEEILQSVSPQLAVILEKQWERGNEYSSQYDTSELDDYINNIDANSILLEQGVNANYLVMREMQSKGIDPRIVGLGYGNQVQQMNLSQYGNLEFSDAGTHGELAKIRQALGVNEAVIESYNMSGDRTITVDIIVG